MKNKNQANISYDKIRTTLLSNELEPGQRLKEALWAENLGVNRADIRQALARLHGEGLLESGNRGGFFVRNYTDQEINEIYELRAVLEMAAAELAIHRATPEDIDELRDICELMKMLAEKDFFLGFNEADLRFHNTLVKSAHNKRLEKIYLSANLPLTNTMLPRIANEKSLKKDASEHLQILEALIQKDIKKIKILLTKGLHTLRLSPCDGLKHR